MSEKRFREIQHALEPKFNLRRKGLSDYILTGPWGFGLYVSYLAVTVRSGCCGMLLRQGNSLSSKCEVCSTPSSLPYPLKEDRTRWPEARVWLETLLVIAGYDVLEATLEASVLDELSELVDVK